MTNWPSAEAEERLSAAARALRGRLAPGGDVEGDLHTLAVVRAALSRSDVDPGTFRLAPAARTALQEAAAALHADGHVNARHVALLAAAPDEAVADAVDALADAAANGVTDPLGTAWESLTKGDRVHGTFLTPPSAAALVARMVAAYADPGSDGTTCVVDPCSGTGRLAAAVAAAVPTARVTAVDTVALATACTKANLAAHGPLHTVLDPEDALSSQALAALAGRVDAVVANPPFGTGAPVSSRAVEVAEEVFGDVRRGGDTNALAFFALALRLLRPGGVAVLVLPDGTVDGRSVRRAADSQFQFVARVQLSEKAFGPSGTNARTSVVAVRRLPSPERACVLAAKAEHAGRRRQGQRIVADRDDLAAIASAVDAHGRFPGPAGQVMSGDPAVVTVAAGGVPAPVGSADAVAARRRCVDAGGRPLSHLLSEASTEPAAADGARPYVSVLHVCHQGLVDWHAAAAHTPATPGQTAKPSQLIVSLINPRKLRAAVVPRHAGEIVCSGEFGVFDVDGDPWEAFVLVHHPDVAAQLSALGIGTSVSRIRVPAAAFLTIVAPVVPADDLARRARDAEQAAGTADDARRRLAAAVAPAAP